MRQPLDVQYLGAGSHTSFNSHAKTLDHNVKAVRLAVYSALQASLPSLPDLLGNTDSS